MVETTQKPKKKSNAGRKQFDGQEEKDVIRKLEEVFIIGGTDIEACVNADICLTSLYEYQKRNPKFTERKRMLKEKPILKARKIVVEKMGDSYANAMDYLKRKRKKEFSERQELTGADGQPLETSDKKYERIVKREGNRLENGESTSAN